MTQTEGQSAEDQSSRGLPLSRLQLALNGITENSIPFNLNAIQRHKQRIVELRENKEWDLLLREQNNGLQTVQRLKADLRALESLAEQVRPSDRQSLSQKILPIQSQICSVVHQFIESNPDLETNPLMSLDFDPSTDSLSDSAEESQTNQRMDSNLQLQADVIQSKGRLHSWQTLTKELNDLNTIFNTLVKTLMGQKEKVDSIEEHIGSAHVDTVLGTQHLAKASALKSAFVPLTTGLISGAVFGPIGMVAGFKFAGIAAGVGGAVIGYMGGKVIQRKAITDEEFELVDNEEKKIKEVKKNE